MKQYAIFKTDEKFNLHTPEHEIHECQTFHHAAVLADQLRRLSKLRWWTDWTTYRPLCGRARWVRNAIVIPVVN